MLNKIRKTKSEGFTIIEVMIVLAIAGLIILIVLLAVPALQRNSRNTAIKNDAGAIAGGVSEFASNNDGNAPNAAGSSNSSGTVTLNNASGSAVTAKVQGSTTYNDADVPAGGATVSPVAGNVYVEFGGKCPATVSGSSVTLTQNSRSTAIVYATEGSGSSVTAKCLDS